MKEQICNTSQINNPLYNKPFFGSPRELIPLLAARILNYESIEDDDRGC